MPTSGSVGDDSIGLATLDRRPESLTALVFEAIRDQIVSRGLPPGSRVSEQRIAAQLSVSKTPVREALLRLRHIGLVESVDRGLHVVGPSIQRIREAYELRAGLEGSAAWYSALRAEDAQRVELLELAHNSVVCAESEDAAGFRQHDHAFHRLLAVSCGNVAVRGAVEDALMLTSVLRQRDAITGGDSISCAHEHVAVATAVAAGDSASACNANRDHVLHVMSLVLAGHTQAMTKSVLSVHSKES